MARRRPPKAVVQAQAEAIRKHLGDSIVFSAPKPVETLSTGIPSLDDALGGGWARRHIAELVGPSQTGKTTLAAQSVADAQKHGFPCCWVDAECRVVGSRLQQLGVDTDALFLVEGIDPDNPKEDDVTATLRMVEATGSILAAAPPVGIVVFDSIAALSPLDTKLAAHARMLSGIIRDQFISAAYRGNSVLLFLNQVRKITSGSGGSTGTGGMAVRHYTSQQVKLYSPFGGSLVKNKVEIGHDIEATVGKNIIGPPKRRVTLELIYETGFCPVASQIRAAIDQKKIVKSGSWYKWGDMSIAQGYPATADVLRADPELLQRIIESPVPKTKSKKKKRTRGKKR